MPRVHFVKKARKADKAAGIKKGDSYYWWQFAYSRKTKSKTRPKPSQLTRSEFWGNIYGLQERDQPSFDDLESELEEIKSELEQWRDEQEEKKSNMPDGLQEGSTGELLQERYDALDAAVSELEAIDIPSEDEVTEDAKTEYEAQEGNGDGSWEKLTEEERDAKVEAKKDEIAGEKWTEIMDALNVSCS